MKAKTALIKLSKPLLVICMTWGLWMGVDIASAIFFGEYEYPEEQ